MSLKEAAEKFPMTKKELDNAYFSEMRSVLNAVEIELNQSRRFQEKTLKIFEKLLVYSEEGLLIDEKLADQIVDLINNY